MYALTAWWQARRLAAVSPGAALALVPHAPPNDALRLTWLSPAELSVDGASRHLARHAERPSLDDC